MILSSRGIIKLLLKDKYSSNIINNYVDSNGWVHGHCEGINEQRTSINMMIIALQMGYKIDIVTRDGNTFECVHPNEVKVKLIYNCSVKLTSDSVVKWRVNSSKLPEGLNLTTENGNNLGFRIDSEDKIFINDSYISDGFIKFNKVNKYKRKIKTVEAYDFSGKPITIDIDIDVYDIINAFSPMGPALQHALKKVLCAGQRGHKDRLQDLKDIIASVQREIELEEGK